MSDRFDGHSLSDLNFSSSRVAELKKYAQGLGKDHGDYGYSAKTEHHFKELDNPTKKGSIQSDMRRIGELLGYKHAGTLNHDKVKDFILAGDDNTEAEPEYKGPKELSPELAHAKARVQQHEEDITSGKYTADLYDMNYRPDGAQSFLNRYKEKLGKQLDNGNYIEQDYQQDTSAKKEATTNSSKVASGANDNSLDTGYYARTGSDNRIRS